jgi:hypothetical protein
MIVTGPDGREYGTAVDCGQRLVDLGHDNGPGLIRKWKQLGHLTPRGYDGHRPVYAIDDVMRVELAMRRSTTRRRGRSRLTSVGRPIHTELA